MSSGSHTDIRTWTKEHVQEWLKRNKYDYTCLVRADGQRLLTYTEEQLIKKMGNDSDGIDLYLDIRRLEALMTAEQRATHGLTLLLSFSDVNLILEIEDDQCVYLGRKAVEGEKDIVRDHKVKKRPGIAKYFNVSGDSVSKIHCCVYFFLGAFHIEDLGSKNQTHCMGEICCAEKEESFQIKPHEPHKVTSHCSFELGRSHCSITILQIGRCGRCPKVGCDVDLGDAVSCPECGTEVIRMGNETKDSSELLNELGQFLGQGAVLPVVPTDLVQKPANQIFPRIYTALANGRFAEAVTILRYWKEQVEIESGLSSWFGAEEDVLVSIMQNRVVSVSNERVMMTMEGRVDLVVIVAAGPFAEDLGRQIFVKSGSKVFITRTNTGLSVMQNVTLTSTPPPNTLMVKCNVEHDSVELVCAADPVPVLLDPTKKGSFALEPDMTNEEIQTLAELENEWERLSAKPHFLDQDMYIRMRHPSEADIYLCIKTKASPPGKLSKPTAHPARDSTGIVVRWKKGTSVTSIHSYEVQVRCPTTSEEWNMTYGGLDLSLRYTPTTWTSDPSVLHEFRIRAVNQSGYSEWSEPVSFPSEVQMNVPFEARAPLVVALDAQLQADLGATSVFRLGRERPSGKIVGIKFLTVTGATKEETIATSSLITERISILEQLRHDNIVNYVGVKKTMVNPFKITVEIYMHWYVSSVKQMMNMMLPSKRLEEHACRRYVTDLLKALAFLHDVSVVHGDLKTANLLLTSDDRVKVADFGAARFLFSNEEDSMASRLIGGFGTAPFMAPEVARTGNPVAQSDVWATGCVLVEMLTGKPPVWGNCVDDVQVMKRISTLDQDTASTMASSIASLASGPSVEFTKKCLRLEINERPRASELLREDTWLASDVQARGAPTPVADEGLEEYYSSSEDEWADRLEFKEDDTDRKGRFNKMEVRTNQNGFQILLDDKPIPLKHNVDTPIVGIDLKVGDLSHPIKRLGAGSQSEVYLVRHIKTNELYAKKESVPTGGEEKKAMRLLMREILMLHCCRHPNIVEFYGAYKFGRQVDLVMELMDVDMANTGLLPPLVISAVARATCAALHYMKSEHNVLHRDIKPSNILCNRAGRIKICDFGISNTCKFGTQVATFMGSTLYSSPERFEEGNLYGHPADMWSLGLVLCELGSGQSPWCSAAIFFNIMKAVDARDFPPICANVEYDLCRDFADKCLKVLPEERMVAADALRDHPFLIGEEEDLAYATQTWLSDFLTQHPDRDPRQ